jgi:hypothetical protein
MSDGMSIGFADFAAILFGFIRVRCVSVRSFLLRKLVRLPVRPRGLGNEQAKPDRIAIATLYIIWYMDII